MSIPEILKRHGSESSSFQILNRALFRRHFKNPSALIGYSRTRKRLILAGAPVCHPSDLERAIHAVRNFAESRRKGLIFFNVENDFIATLKGNPTFQNDILVTKIGEQPIVDPMQWNGFEKANAPNLHNQLHRAEKNGLSCVEWSRSEILGPYKEKALNVMRLWHNGRVLPPLGFTASSDGFSQPGERRYFAVIRGDELFALLICAPIYAKGGWLLETFYRHPDSPQGSTELAAFSAILKLKMEGVTHVSFGFTALSGLESGDVSLRERLLRIIFRLVATFGNRYYSFRGIRSFREKFVPTRWENCYMAVTPFSRRLPGIPALSAIYSVFADTHGARGFYPWRVVRHQFKRLFKSRS